MGVTEKKTIKWGIIGAGDIVRDFAAAILGLPDTCVYGIANRTIERAEKFADEIAEQKPENGRPTVFGSVTEMLADPEVDAVYIGVTNEVHGKYMKECILNGKPVLCEKPFTIDAAEAREVAELAREKGVFCMEAMWSGFLPAWQQAKAEIQSGAIGKILSMDAKFGYYMPVVDKKSRLFDKTKGGGALLDVGIYTVYFVMDFMGRRPDEIKSSAVIGTTGVDEVNDTLLIYYSENAGCAEAQHADGISQAVAGDVSQAVVCRATSAIRAESGYDCVIYGERGNFKFPMHYMSEVVEVTEWSGEGWDAKPEQRKIERPFLVNGYEYEAMEVMDCIRAGKTESERHPLAKTVEMMEVLDEIRKGWKE